MKNRILFALIGLMLPLLAAAQRITDDEAAIIASQVLGKQVVKAEVKKPAKAPGAAPSQCDGELEAPFYSIFTGEDGQGFVIVSTDRRAPQVIGYGDGKADANNLPPQLKAILAKQDSVLQATPNLPGHSSWRKKAPTRADSEGGKLLKTANWGQGYPYNLMTPKIDGEHCPTGCVATAMAIIMKYHGWPEKGRGEHTYDWNGEILSFDYANTTFDWAQMPEDFTEGTFTDAQAQEVSKLMRAAGYAVDMKFNYDESGTYLASVPYNIYRYFKYKLPKAHIKDDYQWYTKKYDDDEWKYIVVEELNNNRPIIYSSQKGITRHAFIIDGVDENTNFHINWGWDGLLNGYYSIGDFLGYNDYANIIRRIQPDKEATDTYENLFIDDGSASLDANTYVGLNVAAEKITNDWTFYYRASVSFDPRELGVGLFNYNLALTDCNDNIKAYSDENPVLHFGVSFDENSNVPATVCLEGSLYFSSDVTINPSDKIQVVFRKADNDDWQLMKSLGDAASSIPVVNNTPQCVKLNINKPENVNVSFSMSDGVIDGNKLLIGSMNTINAISESGIPVIFINGEKRSYYSGQKLIGFSAPVFSNIDQDIDIVLIPNEEMLNLAIDVDVPGTLKSKLNVESANVARSIVVTGTIDEEDIFYIRDNCWVLEELDMSNVTITPDNFLPSNSFDNCGILQKLVLPNNLLGFGTVALTGLLSLDYIVIPSGVEFYGGCSFTAGLKDIIVLNPTPAQIIDQSFNDINYWNAVLWIPKGSLELYKKAEGWKNFVYIEELDGDFVKPEQFIVEPSNVSLKVGETCKLNYKVLPEDATYTEKRIVSYIYEGPSPGTDGLSVENWTITAHREGEYSIHVGLMGLPDNVCHVNVLPMAVPGDVNSDGEVNINDVVRLVAYILGEKVEIDKGAADVNGDGEVNVNDVVKLTGDLLKK